MALPQPEKVLETHKQDGGREIDVNPIIEIIEFILRYAIGTQALKTSEEKDQPVVHGVLDGTQAQETSEEKDQLVVHGVLDVLSTQTIKKISQKISDDSIAVRDANATTMDLLTNILSKYTWDAKVALAFAAFALNYAEFLHFTELQPHKSLAKSIALLKESMEVIELRDLRKNERFAALNDLLGAILDVTKCLVEFEKLSKSIDDIPRDEIACAAYGTILSLVACGSQITSLTNNGYEYIRRMEKWNLSNLVKMVRERHEKLWPKLEEHLKPSIDSFEKLENLLENPQGNVAALTALMNPWHDPEQLLKGYSNTRATIEELKGKKVLLFISDHNLSQEEVNIQEVIHKDSKTKAVEDQYEVVWLPIIDRSIHMSKENRKKLLEKLKSIKWRWYKLDPSIIMLETWVVKYIKEVWGFQKKPILVALDPEGRLACKNALHMMTIWGDRASPYAGKTEEQFWKEETWTLIKLLLYGVLDKSTLDSLDNWPKNQKEFICLYGGKNMKLIKEFATKAISDDEAAKITLHKFYVGTSNNADKTITEEKIDNNKWPATIPKSFFWARLESIRYSKRQNNCLEFHQNNENDPIMRGVLAMLSYDANDLEWAVMSDGSAEMIQAELGAFSKSLSNYDKNVKENAGFLVALNVDLDPYGPYGKIATASPNKMQDSDSGSGSVPIH